MSTNNAVLFSEFVHVESVTLFATRTAHVAFVRQGMNSCRMSVTLVNPRPIDVCAGFVDSQPDSIRILDQNIEDGGWREFGRFRVELCDEDGAFATLEADSFEVHTTEE